MASQLAVDTTDPRAPCRTTLPDASTRTTMPISLPLMPLGGLFHLPDMCLACSGPRVPAHRATPVTESLAVPLGVHRVLYAPHR